MSLNEKPYEETASFSAPSPKWVWDRLGRLTEIPPNQVGEWCDPSTFDSSAQSINLDEITTGDTLNIALVGDKEYALKSIVAITSETDINTYFRGKVLASQPGNVTLEITRIVGGGTVANWVTVESLGQRIEAIEDTNTAVWSQLLSNWNTGLNGFARAEDNVIEGPDGNMSLSRIELLPAADRRGYNDENSSNSYVSGDVRYLSAKFVLEDPTVTTFAIGMYNASGRFCWGAYNALTAEFSTVSYGGAGDIELESVENIRSDLWKLTVRWTCTTGVKYRPCVNMGAGTAGEIYNGANLLQSGTIGAGFVSVQKTASSYISTNGNAVTRDADVMNTSTSFTERYDPVQGWLFIDYVLESDSGYIFSAKDTTLGASRSRVFAYSGSIVVVGSQATATVDVSGDFRGRHKILIRWMDGLIDIFVDGALLISSAQTMPPNLDTVGFFRQPGLSSGLSNGHLFDFQMGTAISDKDAKDMVTL